MTKQDIRPLSENEVDEIAGGPIWPVLVAIGGIIVAMDTLHRENCEVH